MKSTSNSKAEKSKNTSGIKLPRLYLATAVMLTVMVIVFFVWEFYESAYFQSVVSERLSVYQYSVLSVVVIILMLLISLVAWLASIRALHSSQKALLALEIDRQKSEELLRVSETYFRNLLDNANDLFYTTDLKGNFTSFNKIGELITGYSYEEAVKLNIADVIAPECLEFARRMTVRKLKGEPPTTYELNIIAKDRRRITMDVSTRLIYQNEQPVGVQGIARDITVRKLDEAALRESENKYRSLIESLPAIVYVAEPAPPHTPIYISSNVESLGYKQDDWYTKSDFWISILHPEDREWVLQQTEEALKQGRDNKYEYRIITADGSIVWLHDRGRFVMDEAGQRLYWQGVMLDITVRKQAEEEVRRNLSLLASTLEATDNGILAVDLSGKIVSYNKRCVEMWNISENDVELFGRVQDLYRYLDQLKEPETYRLKSTQLASQPELPNNFIFEFKDGRIFERYCQPQVIDGEVVGLVLSFRDITERKQSEERLLHDAFHDSLTGLANRALFTDHLRLRIERGKRDNGGLFAVLFLDFDRFKVINDSLGHAEGDALLILIARRLEAVLRSSDVVARLGGDEFTILLSELDEENDAVLIAERIQKNLKNPFRHRQRRNFYVRQHRHRAQHDWTHEAEDMLRDADIAMYCAKAKGKARHQVFDQAMHDNALNQLQMETEIRQAFENGEFCLHYQPIFTIATNNLAGFEALIRWNHPKRGMVSPGEFIPVAEENGMILPLGRWILYESCRQMREWQNKNPAAASLKLSVNFSCKQFLQSDLVEQVTAALISTRLEPHCLKLEITESHLMENSAQSGKIMYRLREIGVELSLDDFGTGYSSLSYLHRLPVNYLKIDRSFVSRMTESVENNEIVNTIIKLAKNLKMQVVAEGIETAEQLEQLKQLHCEFGQGYFYSKPLEAEAAKLFIDEMSAVSTSFCRTSKSSIWNLICKSIACSFTCVVVSGRDIRASRRR